MKEFLRLRPAVGILFPFVTGILYGYNIYIPFSFVILFILFSLVLFLIFRVFRVKSELLWLPGIIFVFFLGIADIKKTINLPVNHVSNFIGKQENVEVIGFVDKEPVISANNMVLRLEVYSIKKNGIEIETKGKIQVRSHRVKEILYGDEIQCIGILKKPKGKRNPGGFDYREYLRREGIYGILYVKGKDELKVLRQGNGNFILAKFVYPLRRKMHEIFDKTCKDKEEKALLEGIILGKKTSFTQETLKAFADTGTIHILAVSGFNVGVVALVFFIFFRLLLIPWRICRVLLLFILFFYALLTELSPSVLRASIMFVVFILGILIERETDIYNTISIAGFLILLFLPLSIFDIGFQLSFMATLGIIFLYSKFFSLFPDYIRDGRFIIYKWIAGAFCVSLSAQIATAPITLLYFYRFSLISPFANLIIAPIVTFSTALGFATSFGGMIHIEIGRIFSFFNGFLLEFLLKAVYFFGSLPYSSIRMGIPNPVFLIPAYFVFCGGIVYVRKNFLAKGAVILSLIIFLLIFIIGSVKSKSENVSVTFLDVGDGDACFILFPNQKNLLIDTGGRSLEFDAGERLIAPFLWDSKIRVIDGIVFSHPQVDHIGGSIFILDNFRVNRILQSAVDYKTKTNEIIKDKILKKKIRSDTLWAGDTLLFDEKVKVQILHPSLEFIKEMNRDPIPEVNNASVVLKIIYRDVSFLFTGDVGKEIDSLLVSSEYGIRSTIVKVPHHGSLTGSSSIFVRSVSPKIAIVSVSESNRYGFPKEAVVKRYKESDTKFYSTGECGAVRIETDGREFKIETTEVCD